MLMDHNTFLNNAWLSYNLQKNFQKSYFTGFLGNLHFRRFQLQGRFSKNVWSQIFDFSTDFEYLDVKQFTTKRARCTYEVNFGAPPLNARNSLPSRAYYKGGGDNCSFWDFSRPPDSNYDPRTVSKNLIFFRKVRLKLVIFGKIFACGGQNWCISQQQIP